MALKYKDDKGQWHSLTYIYYRSEFDDIWSRFSQEEQCAINKEINRRLDELVASGDAITKISIYGGCVNPDIGVPIDWSRTPFQTIYDHLGGVEGSALFFVNICKLRLIERHEQWICIRNAPTFSREMTYFLSRE